MYISEFVFHVLTPIISTLSTLCSYNRNDSEYTIGVTRRRSSVARAVSTLRLFTQSNARRSVPGGGGEAQEGS